MSYDEGKADFKGGVLAPLVPNAVAPVRGLAPGFRTNKGGPTGHRNWDGGIQGWKRLQCRRFFARVV